MIGFLLNIRSTSEPLKNFLWSDLNLDFFHHCSQFIRELQMPLKSSEKWWDERLHILKKWIFIRILKCSWSPTRYFALKLIYKNALLSSFIKRLWVMWSVQLAAHFMHIFHISSHRTKQTCTGRFHIPTPSKVKGKYTNSPGAGDTHLPHWKNKS